MCCQRELFSSWVDCCDTATPKASYYCALYTVHPFQFIRHTHRIDTLRQIWSGRFIHASQGMPVREVGDAKYILITHIYIEGWKSGPTDAGSHRQKLIARSSLPLIACSQCRQPLSVDTRSLCQVSMPGVDPSGWQVRSRCRSRSIRRYIQMFSSYT